MKKRSNSQKKTRRQRVGLGISDAYVHPEFKTHEICTSLTKETEAEPKEPRPRQ